MCEGSIHVPNRKATAKESLVVRTIPGHGLKGYYPAEPTSKDNKLVCTLRRHDDVRLAQLHLEPMPKYQLSADIQAYDGRKDLKVALIHNGADFIELEPGVLLPLVYVQDGVRVEIGQPVITGDAGMKAVEQALDEQTKTTTSKVGKVLSMTREAIRSRARRAVAAAQRQPMATNRV
jgi:hypothetical protein